jgi:hypothetical protein
MSSSRHPPPIVAPAIVLVLVLLLAGASVVSHLPGRVDNNERDNSSDDAGIGGPRRRRGLLLSGGNPLYWDSHEDYSSLQSPRDVDPAIEARARDRSFAPDGGDGGDDDDDGRSGRCARALVYMPDFFASHGHGSQVQLYVMAALVSTYLDRAMVVLDPPPGMDAAGVPGGSQFGCPPDAFLPPPRGGAFPPLREGFPTGLSRLVRHPAWLSRGCDVPCAGRYSYPEWRKMAQSQPREFGPGDGFAEIECAGPDGDAENVVVVGGSNLRAYRKFPYAAMARDRKSPGAYRWAINLGATAAEANRFSNIADEGRVWDYVLGLANRAGLLRFQPWIARDVERMLVLFDLPRDDDYAAIHVRRGDKLAFEARAEVENFWRDQGHADVENLPTDYVPLRHYLAQWDGPGTCPTDDDGRPMVARHNVYVATDDPVTVRGEIDALPNRVGPNAVMWNDCHELAFYFNPTDADAFHLNGDGEGGFREGNRADTCLDRYHRNIVSVADMFLLCRARTFIGEYNSNWGRVIRTMRVRLDPTLARSEGDGAGGAPARGGLTYTLDTRIAWGSNRVRAPGY